MAGVSVQNKNVPATDKLAEFLQRELGRTKKGFRMCFCKVLNPG